MEYKYQVFISSTYEDLIEERQVAIDKVMKMCGMRDATSFYKAFDEYTGLTPNQYRKKHKKGEIAMNILTAGETRRCAGRTPTKSVSPRPCPATR